MIKNVLFDLDGTLADSKGGIFSSIRYALDKMGVACPEEKVLMTFLGPPLHDSFMNTMGMSEEDATKAVALYREHYAPIGMFNFTLYPGVETMLKKLTQSGRRCYLATSKPEVYAKEILKKAGLESENKNKNYKLDVNLLISHFHSDHVRELSNGLIAHKYMRMLSAYYPAPTVLDQSGVYDNSKNSDIDDRQSVLSALTRVWPQAEQHEIGFGDTYIVDTNIGELKLFASDMDWGTPENAKYAEDVYYPTDLAARRADMPVAVVNCNCLWMRFAFAGHSVLFTGDTMKKKTDVNDEPLDRFIAYYGGEALKSDIIKYPHHGLSRNPAALPIQQHLITDHELACCILTGNKAGEKAGAALDKVGVKWYDIDGGTVVYSLTEDGLSKIS